MGEAVQLTSHTEPSSDYVSQLFSKPQIDLRYKKVTFQNFYSVNTIRTNSRTVSFSLPAWRSASGNKFLFKTAFSRLYFFLFLFTAYKLKDTVLIIKLAILNNGEQVPKDTKAAFINNILHSVIGSLKVYLNDKCINANCENYAYKAYIKYMASFDTDSKTSVLEAQGYYEDDESQVRKLCMHMWGKLINYLLLQQFYGQQTRRKRSKQRIYFKNGSFPKQRSMEHWCCNICG